MILFDLPPPPDLWLPPKPAIHRPAPADVLAIVPGLVPGPGLMAGAARIEFEFIASSNLADTSNSGEYTFSDAPLGTADAARYIVAQISGPGNSGGVVTSVTIGGVSASMVSDGSTSARANGGVICDLWIAAVPSGTTGDVVVDWDAGQQRCAIALYRMIGNASVQAHDVAIDETESSGSLSASLTIPPNGAGVGATYWNSTSGFPTTTWTNLTEDHDTSTTEGNNTFSAASSRTAGTETRTATATETLVGHSLVLASWAP